MHTQKKKSGKQSDKEKIKEQKQYTLPLNSFEIPDFAQLLREDTS